MSTAAKLKPSLIAQPSDSLPRFLTVEEVARMLRCRPRTIYSMVSEKRIPYRKAGRLLRFDAAEIDQWTKAAARKQ